MLDAMLMHSNPIFKSYPVYVESIRKGCEPVSTFEALTSMDHMCSVCSTWSQFFEASTQILPAMRVYSY